MASTKALEQTSCKGREGTSAMGGEEVTDHANVLIVGMLIIVADNEESQSHHLFIR